MAESELIPTEYVERVIIVLRGHRVMLDADLAALYGVQTKVLNQAVRRNRARFPGDFMFQLTLEEAQRSRSQTVTLNAQTSENIGVLSPGQRPRSRGANIKFPYGTYQLRKLQLVRCQQGPPLQ